MNWLLGLFAFGVLLIAGALLWQQIKADAEFREFLEREGYPIRKED